MLSPKLAEALGMTSQKINDINCVKFIWWHFYQMYRILRKNTAQLKPGHPSSSTNVEDCEFGLQMTLKFPDMFTMPICSML